MWEEVFGFCIPPAKIDNPSSALTVMVWDHDFLTPDDFMGQIEIPLKDIPRDSSAHPFDPSGIPHDPSSSSLNNADDGNGNGNESDEKWFQLEGAKSGEVCLSLKRVVLTSPHLRDVLLKLERYPKCWNRKLLEKYSVGINHFLGTDPWNFADQKASLVSGFPQSLHDNPALANIETLLHSQRLQLSNQKTVAKVANILWSQGALKTHDIPSRYVWISDVTIPPKDVYLLIQFLSKGALKVFSYFPHLPRPHTKRLGSIACAFRTSEDALSVLLALQNRELSLTPPSASVSVDNFDMLESPSRNSEGDNDPVNHRVSVHGVRPNALHSSPVSVGFGPPVKLAEDGLTLDHPFEYSLRVGMVSIAGPYSTSVDMEQKVADEGQSHMSSKWMKYILVLRKDGRCEAYLRLQDAQTSKPTFSWDINDILLLVCGPWSAEIVDKESKLSYYIKGNSSEDLKSWRFAFKIAKATAATGSDDDGLPSSPSISNSISSLSLEERKDGGAPPAYGTVGNEIDWKSFVMTGVCERCQETLPIHTMYLLDAQHGRKDPFSCIPCLRRLILERIEAAKRARVEADPNNVVAMGGGGGGEESASSANAILSLFSLQDMRDLGVQDIFASFLDTCVDEMLDANTNSTSILHCPQCETPFEFVYHSWASRQANVTKELGLDNRPLTPSAEAHFLNNRFRCPDIKCNITFCRLCQRKPYHIGFTCREYVEYLNAPKCRFCTVAVTRRNKWKNVSHFAFEDVCDGEECINKAHQSCPRKLPCGHFCGGVRTEQEHLPCLQEECVNRRKLEIKSSLASKVDLDLTGSSDSKESELEVEKKLSEDDVQRVKCATTVSDDLCGICYVEELGRAPSIMLQCGHVFHSKCALSRLESKWTGQRISLKFAHCPLCDTWMDHPFLDHKMKEIIEIRETILDKIEIRLALDMEDEQDLIERTSDPDSYYYKKPMLWGINSYAFYMCRICKGPYFGGRRNCEENAEEDKTNEDELVCFSCSEVMSSNACKEPSHSEYLLYKCRFCCSPAVWFCFGTTHFCEYCHSHWPPNRHPENIKCPNDEGVCPMGLPVGSHSNGEGEECEYVIGCGMCQNELRMKKSNNKEEVLTEEEKEAAEKASRGRFRPERLSMYPPIPHRLGGPGPEVIQLRVGHDVPDPLAFHDDDDDQIAPLDDGHKPFANAVHNIARGLLNRFFGNREQEAKVVNERDEEEEQGVDMQAPAPYVGVQALRDALLRDVRDFPQRDIGPNVLIRHGEDNALDRAEAEYQAAPRVVGRGGRHRRNRRKRRGDKKRLGR